MEKPIVNLVVLGHAGAGKSTTAGRLLQESRTADDQLLEQCGAEAENIVKASQDSKGDRNISIDSCHRSMESSRYRFNVMDAPGNPEFIGTTIAVSFQADVALLVVDSSTEGYKIGFANDGQTREHALLSYALGVKQMVVAVNRMDDTSINFSEDRFKLIRTEVSTYLRRVGYKPMKIPFIPISGWLGENINALSIYMPWYRGPTLMEALNNVNRPRRYVDRPLRLPIQHAHPDPDGIGSILVGRIETGTMLTRMKVQCVPGNTAIVEEIQIDSVTVSAASAGEIVRIKVSPDDKSDTNSEFDHGHVLLDCDCSLGEVSSFQAQIIMMDDANEVSTGNMVTVFCQALDMQCKVRSIKEKMDRRTGKLLEINPATVLAGEACILELEPKSPMCVEPFKDFPPLGRFVVRDLTNTIAYGVVKAVNRTQLSASPEK